MTATAHELPAWECYDLLRDHGVGRLCLVDSGYPITVPINYRVLDDESEQQLVVRTLLRTRWSGNTTDPPRWRSTTSIW